MTSLVQRLRRLAAAGATSSTHSALHPHLLPPLREAVVGHIIPSRHQRVVVVSSVTLLVLVLEGAALMPSVPSPHLPLRQHLRQHLHLPRMQTSRASSLLTACPCLMQTIVSRGWWLASFRQKVLV